MAKIVHSYSLREGEILEVHWIRKNETEHIERYTCPPPIVQIARAEKEEPHAKLRTTDQG